MEPRIQYAQAEDGVNIAYWTLGEGTPLVYLPMPYSHIQLEWQIPEYRIWYERLSEKRKLVRYDARGTGLSDRDVATFSLNAHLADLEAVVDRLGLASVALFGPFLFGPVAIAYAARHPERVSQLLLWCSWARATDAYQSPQAQSIVALRDKDWTTYTESVAHILLGWSAGEPARQLAAIVREGVTQETMRALAPVATQFDVTESLAELKAPTLVLQRRQVAFPEVHVAKGLASHIPDARLALLEGASLFPQLGDMDAALDAIDDCLNEREEAEATTELPEGMAVILFADIAESTALTEKLGDAAFRAKARELDALLRGLIRACSGAPVDGKVLGDGVMAVFTSAREAIDAALRCHALSAESELRLHLGIHAGDVIREEHNVYGGAVNIASRICALSQPGEVLVSDVVRGMARTSAGVAFEDRGEQEMKGVGEPVRVYAVREGSA